MPGVKQITEEGRTKINEVRMKNNDRIEKGKRDISAVDNEVVTLDEHEEEYAPKVVNKAKTCEMNMQRQYKRRVNHCTIRKPFRIHDFTKLGDHGAQDKSLVYVAFQGGLFEALKQNMVKILKENKQSPG